MKIVKLTAFTLIILASEISLAQQPNASDILKKLSEFSDQHGDEFDSNDYRDTLTLILIEGTNSSFSEVYSKFKYKRLIENVRVVAGYGNVMTTLDNEAKLDHLANGFSSKEGLGKEAYSILFDLDSELVDLLNLNQYSIVDIDLKKKNFDIRDFGDDRIEFMNAIREYFK